MKTTSLPQPQEAQKKDNGLTRKGAWIILLSFNIITFLIGYLKLDNQGYILESFKGLSILMFIFISLNRLPNIGWSKWLTLLAIIPFLNLIFMAFLFVLPKDYAKNRKVDTPGLVLIPCFVVILGLAMFSQSIEDEKNHKISHELDAAMQSRAQRMADVMNKISGELQQERQSAKEIPMGGKVNNDMNSQQTKTRSLEEILKSR